MNSPLLFSAEPHGFRVQREKNGPGQYIRNYSQKTWNVTFTIEYSVVTDQVFPLSLLSFFCFSYLTNIINSTKKKAVILQ